MIKKKNIEFARITHLRGPNIWTYRPVIEAWVDIGELEDYPSNTLPGLYERLVAVTPGMIEHRCGVGERGGFFERLREGTWSAHPRWCWNCKTWQACARASARRARPASAASTRWLSARARRARGPRRPGAARELLMAAINDEAADLEAALAPLHDVVDARCLNPSTASIVDAAAERRIPSLRLNDGNPGAAGPRPPHRSAASERPKRTAPARSPKGIASDGRT